jgi:protocatechuate 3,4-dioxygenase beta subunit
MDQPQPTAATTEGPYYKTGSPARTELHEPGVPGQPLILTGYVLDLHRRPVPRAWLDFWQADGTGQYDNAGYVLRGHQFTDQAGRFTLHTVVPGTYPGRTPHIHVKVRPGTGGPTLTTQLFIPGLPSNRTDPIFRTHLLVTMSDAPEDKAAVFTFVLDLS